MRDEDRKSLSTVRLAHSEECLSAAKSLKETENYKSAANRAYYTVFHAMRAVLALNEIDMKRHSGVISEFRRLYIKTGIFQSELSQIISSLFEIRSDSDYDDFFVISKDEVNEQIQNAEQFLTSVRLYLAEVEDKYE